MAFPLCRGGRRKKADLIESINQNLPKISRADKLTSNILAECFVRLEFNKKAYIFLVHDGLCFWDMDSGPLSCGQPPAGGPCGQTVDKPGRPGRPPDALPTACQHLPTAAPVCRAKTLAAIWIYPHPKTNPLSSRQSSLSRPTTHPRAPRARI